MKLQYLRIGFLLFSIAFSLTLSAQSFRVTHYTKEDGLHSELTKSLTQDTLGFIWIASDGGLIKFNGYKFELFKDQLISPYVKDVLVDKNGKLLILTDNGLMQASYTVNDIEFSTRITNRGDQGDSLMWFPKQLMKLHSGNIWATDKSHVYLIGDSVIKPYKLPFKGYSNDWQRASTLFENDEGTTFVISQSGYWFYIDKSTDKLTELNVEHFLTEVQDAVWLGENRVMISSHGLVYVCLLSGNDVISYQEVGKLHVSYFLKQADGSIYASTWLNGLFQIVDDGKRFAFNKMTNYTINSANHMAEGRDGSVWVTSDNGLLLLQEKNFTGVFSNITKSYIQCLNEDQLGFIYFSDGGRVFKIDKSRKKPYAQEIYRVKDKAILQVVPTPKGLWMGDSQGFITWVPESGPEKIFDLTNRGRAVFFMQKDKAGNIWACQDGNEQLIRISPDLKLSFYGAQQGISARPIVVKLDNNGEVYVGASNDLGFLFMYAKASDRFMNLSKPLNFLHADQIVVNDIAFADSFIWLGTSFGLLQYKHGAVSQASEANSVMEAIKFLGIDSNKDLWYANSNGLNKYLENGSIVFDEGEGLPSKTLAYRCFLIDRDKDFWVGTVSGLAVSKKIDASKKTPCPVFVEVKNESGAFNYRNENVFFTDNFLNFQFVAPVFPSKSVIYEWRLLGKDTLDWTSIEFNKEVLVTKLKPGLFTFEVRARQDGNFLWSDSLQYKFKATLVWYKRWWVWVLILLAGATSVIGIVRYYTWNLNRRNLLLEELVKNRTHEIKQSEERLREVNEHLAFQTQALDESALVSMADTHGIITYVNHKFCEISQYSTSELIGKPHSIINSGYHSQVFFNEMWSAIRKGKWRGEFCNRAKDGSIYWVDATIVPFLDHNGEAYQYLAIRFDITEKKKNEKELFEQKSAIELQNKHIRSSINYASRIQDAVLKTNNLLTENFAENFVFYHPKEVVSGDFYWVKEIKGKIIVVAADCTGHGVPGAFMSMLGIASLNEIVNTKHITQPSEILEQLRLKIKSSLRQTGALKEAKDGMDMSICVFDFNTMQLRYAGANNPAYLIRGDEFFNFEPTKNPVGVYPKEKPFISEIIQLQKHDTIYMFSDGYSDQFDSRGFERFKRYRFKSLLLEHVRLPLNQQCTELTKAHNQWRGNTPQLDDMLIIGLRV